MDLRNYLKKQIEKGKTSWESRSALFRDAEVQRNGNNNKILKEYEKKFQFGIVIKIKNKAIQSYFEKQKKNSLINVEGAVKIINQNLSKDMQISETIIYNRLNDPKFNKNNLKGQTLYTQVSKFGEYNKKISKEFEEKILKIKEEGVYLSIEETQRGSQSLRLRTSKEKGNLDKSFPPNENSVKIITKLIKGE